MPKIELSSKWTCDGRELKPKVGATPSDTWIYNGKEIKPKLAQDHLIFGYLMVVS